MVATASDTLCWFAHRGWHGRSLEALTILLLFDSRLSRVLCFSVSDISMSAGSRERGQDLPRCPVRMQMMPLLGLAPFREYHQTLGFRGVASIQDMPYRLASKKKMKLALLSQSSSARHGPLSPSVADSRTSSSIRKPPPFALHVHSEGVDEILFACFCLSSGPSST
ncbi:hypothetical protein DTO212C5_2932 [Paecilomyces variotii]|nr:hypothetical protein DTO212C5_2932 [Paecilomyces variotii]